MIYIKPSIDIIGNENCASCFSCSNVCPESAIKMELSDEGFYKPIIDRNACTECGLCQKHCPVILSDEISNNNSNNPRVFAAWSKDDLTRLSSSSGGAFSELAKIIIDNDGVVYGAAWDSDFSVKHIGIYSFDSINLLRGSKYIPSNLDSVYKEIQRITNEGRKVLFSGTPCQVAAVKTFVASNRLFTVDLICHGVPSLRVFKAYLEYIRNNRIIKDINFRDKETGWSNFSISVNFEDGSKYIEKFNNDDFCWGFNNNYYLNSICYNCPFAKLPRQGDITVGDFWNVAENLKNEKGVSVVLVNNEKGERIIKLTENLCLEKVELSAAVRGNPRIINGEFNKPKVREMLLKDINSNGFEYIKRKYLKRPNKALVFLKKVIREIFVIK